MKFYFFPIVCSIITFGMAFLQLLLTSGFPFGEYALGGRTKVLPAGMRLISGAFTLIFAFIGMVYLQKGGILNTGLHPAAVNIIISINTLFLAYAIAGNGILTKSRKEKYVMTPLSAVQFILSIITLFSGK